MNDSIRQPAVAGMFYPGSASVLAGELQFLLAEAKDDVDLPSPKAIIAPHAGYVYSGAVAASVYMLLKSRATTIRRVVLLGPTHRVGIHGLALPDVAFFATPLGPVEIDHNAATAISDLPQVIKTNAPHAQEHSLEVQLPFLQTILPHFRLLPLAVGAASPEAVAEVLERLWGGDETLIVISSDLSHYLPYAAAQEIDASTAKRILACDPKITHDEACGATPLNGLLLAARQHHLAPRLIDLRNSGDTSSDRVRVVGYGSFAFYPQRENGAH